MRQTLLLALALMGLIGTAAAQSEPAEEVPAVLDTSPATVIAADEEPSGSLESLSAGYACACDATDCCCQQRLTFSADVLWLDRNFGSRNFLGQTVALRTGTPVQSLFPGGSSFLPGMRLQLNYMLDDCLTLEGIYFGLQQWSSNGSIAANPAAGVQAFSPFTQSDDLLRGFNQSLGYTYGSRLNNAELNVRGQTAAYGRWTRENLLGFRFVELNEGFNLNGQDQFIPVSENLSTHTSNSLVGTQIGTAVRGNWNRLSVNMTGKTGLFANFISERFSNLNSTGVTPGFPPGFVPITRGKVATEVAGVLDFSAIATYQVNSNFSIRGGYQLLYLAGVALASQQLSGYSHGGDVFLHGPSLGFNYSH